MAKRKGISFVGSSREDLRAFPKPVTIEIGASLGVLHHLPNTLAGLESCVKKLRQGAPFLAYIYYAFDNRPLWYRCLWKISDFGRRIISRLPFAIKYPVTQTIAGVIYYPLARCALLMETLGFNIKSIPLSAYRKSSFYSMRTDALDRFGTSLEQRFTREQIRAMMEDAGLDNIKFSEEIPYWCAVGFKK